VAFVLAATIPCFADYVTHPELRPAERCGMIPPAGEDPGGAASKHCQRLFWDLPAATRVGFTAAAAPIPTDRVPKFLHGLVDRPPPLFILDANGDGVADDGKGYEQEAPGRVRLCSDVDEVPWWQPVVDNAGNARTGKDPTYGQTGPLHVVACRRGTRVRFGPWQLGTHPEAGDALAEGILRFENSARLDRDVEKRGLDPKKQGRREWYTGLEIYNHFAVHHIACWNPENDLCNNPEDPWTASDAKRCRAGFQEVADGPDDPHGKGGCYAGDQDTRCTIPNQTAQTFRLLVMPPGRTAEQLPPGQGVITLEDQLWRCYDHVTNQYPPDATGKDPAFHMASTNMWGIVGLADFRKQQGGLSNIADELQHDVKPGKGIGGAVGEFVLQYFTEPYTNTSVARYTATSPVRAGGLEDFLQRFGSKLQKKTPAAGAKP
jgi:hypothetical protein